MQVLFEQTLHEAKREWRSLSFRQRRLISLSLLVGFCGLLWLGIVAVLVRVL
jgi:hypothetical protein